MPEKRWVVRVFWEPSQRLDATAVSLVLCRLQANSAVIGQHPVDGMWEATVSIEAPTAETASSQAWDLVVGAGENPLGVEVLREHVVECGSDLHGPRPDLAD
ncbi:MAG TPA: hypothetical protein PLZ93_00815 [Nocardioides sp.]|uniref:hypothetical protein n=1 Tax=uncultured Nocardioides sp. TaxID=198441 RepID=UPI002638AD98|nr:hypothetical protein [uncultured Nocardioides sp.]HRI94134.1 hypothetical protein [Nocardioides sp.]HRK44083.1 hypothetical protein [Nocardioides sp.]